MHGFVGGYLAPVIGAAPRPADLWSFVLEADMTLVVQPNVVSPDGTRGVQTGELLQVTPSGGARLHRFPPGFGRIA